LAWGIGANAVRQVISIRDDRLWGRLAAKIDAGYIEITSDPVTGSEAPTAPVPGPRFMQLSEPPNTGDSIVFNAATGMFDPQPPAPNISQIPLPENATIADIAQAFNDLRSSLIEGAVIAPDQS
jgi:hypothetical protein